MMSPIQDEPTAANGHVGPHPSYIQIAKPFIFEQTIQDSLKSTGVSEAKEDSVRLQGVAWIDSVRKALRLPVRTFNTAVVYYHRFRLIHSDSEYSYIDAAGAALFTACKIEDTLKRSKEILCAAYNLKLSTGEHLTQDDPMFEGPSKTIVGLERLMLEASAFDFRSHNPQKLLIKIAKYYKVDKRTVGRAAFNMSQDLYRTFAPLKQTAQTMAFACVELASRLHNKRIEDLEAGYAYDRWNTSRAEVMETLLDLLEVYTHHRNSTIIGQTHPIETFIPIRITLNNEAKDYNIPRHTTLHTLSNGNHIPTNGAASSKTTSPVSPLDTPATAPEATPKSAASSGPTPTRNRAGFRDGTVRFMLDAEQARQEKSVVNEFWKVEEEDVEVEVEVPRDRNEGDRHNKHRKRWGAD